MNPHRKPRFRFIKRAAILAAVLTVSPILPVAAAEPLRNPVITLPVPAVAWGWMKTSLIYSNAGRTDRQWQQNLVGVDSSGRLGTYQLFDSYVLLQSSINGKDPAYSELNPSDLGALLDQQFADAAKLDRAARSLGQRVQLGLSMPWISNQMWFEIPGYGSVNTANAADRDKVSDWYLGKLIDRARNAGWTNTSLSAIYYQREDIIGARGDPGLATHMNQTIKAQSLLSVWIPYYDSPNRLNGEALGFDRVIIQPSYAFKGREDNGSVTAARLSALAETVKGTNIGMEYEIRNQGGTDYSAAVAHQYLAVSQQTGLDTKPQAFFHGETNLFDRVSGQSSTVPSMWRAYQDLTGYLRGARISNLDRTISFTPTGITSQSSTFVLAPGENTVRLDFKDAGTGSTQRWAGTLGLISFDAAGKTLGTSYAATQGFSELDGTFRSVMVPVAQANKAVKATVVITPAITGTQNLTQPKLMASSYEPFGVPSTGQLVFSSSNDETATQFNDAAVVTAGWGKGKLTDGNKSTDGSWWGSNADRLVGWSQAEVTVIIDLGKDTQLSSFNVDTHQDSLAGVSWPNSLAALATNVPAGFTGSQASTTTPGYIAQAFPGQRPAVAGTAAFYDTMSGRFTTGAHGRYVSVSLSTSGWALLDEVRILDSTGKNVAQGTSYILLSKPRSSTGGYRNTGTGLADGTVPAVFNSGQFTGFERNRAQWLQATLTVPANMASARLWLNNDTTWGVSVPKTATFDWRDAAGIWRAGGPITAKTACDGTTIPCADLPLPNQVISAFRINLPQEAGGWTMISELTATRR
ncbi:DUF4855 domain-containing protein [Arthrobacter sp. MMS24-S77]